MPDTTSDAHAGPDRRGKARRQDDLIVLTKDEFAAAVADVGHQVGQVHRRRVAIQCFCISLIVCVIGGLLAFRLIKQSDQSHAAYDCQLVRELSFPLSDFVATDAAIRLKQARQNVTPTLLRDFEKIIPLGQLQKLAKQSGDNSTATASHWQTVDLPPLERLEHLDCHAAHPTKPASRLRGG